MLQHFWSKLKELNETRGGDCKGFVLKKVLNLKENFECLSILSFHKRGYFGGECCCEVKLKLLLLSLFGIDWPKSNYCLQTSDTCS